MVTGARSVKWLKKSFMKCITERQLWNLSEINERDHAVRTEVLGQSCLTNQLMSVMQRTMRIDADPIWLIAVNRQNLWGLRTILVSKSSVNQQVKGPQIKTSSQNKNNKQGHYVSAIHKKSSGNKWLRRLESLRQSSISHVIQSWTKEHRSHVSKQPCISGQSTEAIMVQKNTYRLHVTCSSCHQSSGWLSSKAVHRGQRQWYSQTLKSSRTSASCGSWRCFELRM
jgi:hypothetical protein